jgi:hypothetical protein
MNLFTFTIFCQQVDKVGTIHINSVQAADIESAIQAGREQCLADWNGGNAESDAPFILEDIHCLGVAAGDVTILYWEDQTDW